MFRMRYIIIVAITLQSLLESLEADDPLKGLYPDTIKCFEGIPQNVTASFQMINPLNEKCLRNLSINTMDANPVCFKACVLQNMYKITVKPYPDRPDLWEKWDDKNFDQDELLRIENEEANGYNYTLPYWDVPEILLDFYEGKRKEEEVTPEDYEDSIKVEDDDDDDIGDFPEGGDATVDERKKNRNYTVHFGPPYIVA